MHHVAIQRSDRLRARFMTQISMYDLAMLIWLDEMGCDGCHTKRKYGYSICKLLLCNDHLLVRRVRYTAIPVISMEGLSVHVLHAPSWLIALEFWSCANLAQILRSYF